MNRDEKVSFIDHLHGRLEKAQGAFLVDYQGLSVGELNRLRGELRKVNAEFEVVKNRLLKLASQGTGTEAMIDQMRGPSAIALTYENVVSPAKALVDFAKEVKKLKIKMGQISGRAITEDGVRNLAALPSRDVLLAQTLSVMQAVPTSFVRALSGVLTNLMNVLRAIREQKETSQ
ncbi:MAG: large subunit ribosomal protein [Thermodesulfobacteriota bacterium]|nr:large subunit ribosomal protein [Thermodesulfobacteriota bacterium]